MSAASGAAAQFSAGVAALTSLRERNFFWSPWFTWAAENVSGSNGHRHLSRFSCSSCSGSARTREETEIQHDSFFGMTIADAAPKYLLVQATLTSLVKDGSLVKAQHGYRFPKANAA
jgi:hypothetical protein